MTVSLVCHLNVSDKETSLFEEFFQKSIHWLRAVVDCGSFHLCRCVIVEALLKIPANHFTIPGRGHWCMHALRYHNRWIKVFSQIEHYVFFEPTWSRSTELLHSSWKNETFPFTSIWKYSIIAMTTITKHHGHFAFQVRQQVSGDGSVCLNLSLTFLFSLRMLNVHALSKWELPFYLQILQN